jgi:hypothetical protein
MVWVECGGVMVKTKVTLDIIHGKEHTMTGKITSS